MQQKHGAVSGLEAVFRRRFPGTRFEYNTMNFNRLWTRDFEHDKGEAIYIQFLQALSEQRTENSSAADNAVIDVYPLQHPNGLPEK